MLGLLGSGQVSCEAPVPWMICNMLPMSCLCHTVPGFRLTATLGRKTCITLPATDVEDEHSLLAIICSFSRMRSEGFPFIVGGLGVGPFFAASWSARRFSRRFRVIFASFFASFFASLIPCL